MNILLIEDDAGLIELITENLEKLGFSVMSAVSGAEALAYLSKQIPDMILLDYSLPDINGKELIETLNKQQIPLPPFIITTGRGDERIAVNMMKLGAMDYVIKDILFLEKLPDVVLRVAKEIASEGKLKQAEEALHKSDIKYKVLFESMTEMFQVIELIYDKNGNAIDYYYRQVNPAFVNFVGEPKEQLIGKRAKDIYGIIEDHWIKIYENVDKTGASVTYENYGEELDKFYSIKAWRIRKNFIGVIITDITEKKKADKALRESDERFNLAMTASKDGLFDWNLLTNEIYYSPGWKSMLGYKDDELPNEFSVWEKLTEPEAEEKTQKMLQEVINKQRDRFKLEFKMKHKNGHWVDILSRAEAFFDDKGKAIRMVGTHVDITERKRAEEKIRVAEENLKNTFDLSPSIICKANVDTGYFMEVNQAVTRILGYTLEEFTSKPLMEFIHPDDRQRTEDEISEQLKGRETTFFENRYLCKDGSYKWMAWHSTKANKNGIVTAIASDISDRKQAEGTVRKLSTAVKQSPSMIVISDTEGNLEYVNPRFTELTGYSSSEVIGKNPNILKSGKQDSVFYKEMWETIKSGNVWRGQFQNKKKNGELYWEGASISAILDESGNINNFIKFADDITQQKITETELKIALEKALESDRLKSAFLANMSHEIRTPMNGILGFVDLLNKPNLSKSKINKYSNIINKSGKRLLNTINDIIDISKIEAGEMLMFNTETSINSIMEELHSFFSPEAKLKGLSLILEPSLTNSPTNIITDDYKLHGILTNLIKNAIKYTEKGSVTFGYSVKENFIDFFVEDTGIGIPKDRLQAIFNRFEQADIADTKVFEGSGLGLAISKAYTKMLGGEISVTSDEGKGSRFTFIIPKVQNLKKETEQFPESIDNDAARIEKLNLLIVEDDDVSSELLKSTLQELFKEIIVVDNGKDAIETCRKNPELDLVLMDLKMPKMNGYDATKEIRTFNKDLVIIAQTAYAFHGGKEKAIEVGCNDYITKPINKVLLVEIINKLLG